MCTIFVKYMRSAPKFIPLLNKLQLLVIFLHICSLAVAIPIAQKFGRGMSS